MYGGSFEARIRMTATESHDAHNYLQNPAVIAMDWIGFIVLFGSSFVLVYKLMYFKGPAQQPESYFFGCALLFLIVIYSFGLIELI